MRTLGDKVVIHYVGSLASGEVFDNHKDGEPLEITIGIDPVLPGLEDALKTMEVGEERIVILPCEEAYGPHDPDGLIRYEREGFPDADSLVEGQIIEFFADGKGLCAYPRVVSCEGEHVILDFNHPLAGKELTYWIKLESSMCESA